MNKYIRAAVVISFGTIKSLWTKMFHITEFSAPLICMISPFTEITLEYGGELRIGHGFKMRDGAKIRVRKNAKMVIGKNTSINSNNIIACRENISIGDNVQLSPNVMIYDHDHDFRTAGGISTMKYRTDSITIGNNVWIGANSVILKGTSIGDNCVIGAGSIVKGVVEQNTVFVQKRQSIGRKINE